MIKESIKRFKIYEYIRDNDKITSEMSNTKRLIVELMQNNKETEEFCIKKLEEERREVEEAIKGEHFHKNMTRREILVNEISQYIYWITILAISKNLTFEKVEIDEKVNEILKQIDILKIGEEKKITLEEVIRYDLDEMKQKEYLESIISYL